MLFEYIRACLDEADSYLDLTLRSVEQTKIFDGNLLSEVNRLYLNLSDLFNLLSDVATNAEFFDSVYPLMQQTLSLIKKTQQVTKKLCNILREEILWDY